ncbi:hypothetical protein ACQ4PT_069743 [Festuca glaucescens]
MKTPARRRTEEKEDVVTERPCGNQSASGWEKKPDYIGRITEIFEGTDHGCYFNCRWFFWSKDTVISTAKLVDDHTHDPKRVFLSDERNDNPLDCIVSKVKILQIDPKLDQKAKAQLLDGFDLYYDMSYTVAYSTFANIMNAPPVEDEEEEGELEEDVYVAVKLTEICYGGADRKSCIYFKVQWKGFGREDDTWEPIENLSLFMKAMREKSYLCP